MAKKSHEIEITETIQPEPEEQVEPQVEVEEDDVFVAPPPVDVFEHVFFLGEGRKTNRYPAIVQSINPDGSFRLAVFEMNSVRFTDAIEGDGPGNFVRI